MSGEAGKSSYLIKVFLLLSLVSFFADFTYEGARSISGPYLSELGASLVIASSISLGESLSYAGRLLSGLLAYKYGSPRFYWGMVFLGYLVNLGAVPLLAFSGNWEEAYILYILERVGKGLRVPVRDAILSEVGSGLGSGKLFGIHELLDQGGAIAGALFISWSLGGAGVKRGLLFLAIPAAIAIMLLAAAYWMHPKPSVAAKPLRGAGLLLRDALKLSIPLAASMLVFIHWATAGYILSTRLEAETIALLYSLAMLADGIIAVPLGLLYDAWGGRTLVLTPILSASATITLFTAGPIVFAVVWGAAMATYETLVKAYISDHVREEERGVVYGVVYAVMGLSWTIGNVILAYLI